MENNIPLEDADSYSEMSVRVNGEILYSIRLNNTRSIKLGLKLNNRSLSVDKDWSVGAGRLGICFSIFVGKGY